MAPTTKAFGKTMFLTEGEFSCRLMAAGMKESSKTTKVTDLASTSQQMGNSSMRDSLRMTCKTGLALKLEWESIDIRGILKIGRRRAQGR